MNAIWIVPTLFAVATFSVAVVGILLRTGGLSGLWPGVTLAFAELLPVLRLRASSLGIRITDWLLVDAWPIGTGLSLLLICLRLVLCGLVLQPAASENEGTDGEGGRDDGQNQNHGS